MKDSKNFNGMGWSHDGSPVIGQGTLSFFHIVDIELPKLNVQYLD